MRSNRELTNLIPAGSEGVGFGLDFVVVDRNGELAHQCVEIRLAETCADQAQLDGLPLRPTAIRFRSGENLVPSTTACGSDSTSGGGIAEHGVRAGSVNRRGRFDAAEWVGSTLEAEGVQGPAGTAAWWWACREAQGQPIHFQGRV
jgi:hypothetical protein